MLVNQEFLNNLRPVEIELIKSCIYALEKEKLTKETTNYENLKGTVCDCPKCHSTKYIKYGFNPHKKQKYKCKDCGAVFMATTDTFFSHCRSSYETWATFIACELNGDSLEHESLQTEKSITTCFNMRHKLYAAAGRQLNSQLSGQVETDAAYMKINLKGTKPKNMPRYSKKRGKHKSSCYSKELSGISHHKICVISAVDEYDNMLCRISGLGSESLEKYNQYASYFEEGSTIISDSKTCIKKFAEEHNMISEQIPVRAGKQIFTTKNGNSLGDINEIHTQIKNLIRNKHGFSTRHAQGYLDWLIFKKQLRYRIELRQRKSTAYMKVMREGVPFTNADITTLPQPIDLYEAYGEYHYGIFADVNYS